MLLLRTLPNVADTPANRDFRRYFYSKWGKETCIISARERRAEYPMFTPCLSVKAARGGSERYYLDGGKKLWALCLPHPTALSTLATSL